MPKLKTLDDWVKDFPTYIKSNPVKRHPAYKETVNIMGWLRMHADGLKPSDVMIDGKPCDVITARRPSEDVSKAEYREKIFIPITKMPFEKIMNTITRIHEAEDWKVDYTKSLEPAAIPKDDSLQEYCEKDFPEFKNIVNWFFTIALKVTLADPNAVCAILPRDYDYGDNEFPEPFPYVFHSDKVLDYVSGQYCVLMAEELCDFQTIAGITRHDGEVYWIVASNMIIRCTQKNENKDFTLTLMRNVEFNEMPAFKFGGNYKKMVNTTPLFESFISGTLPYFNEAMREYSDSQAEVVLNLHSTYWYYNNEDCPTCKGIGQIKDGRATNSSNAYIQCPTCNGDGAPSSSPYKQIKIRPNLPGETSSPIPPAGYIQKDINLIKIIEDRINGHINKSYSAINFDFLTNTPMAQSGTAKAYDRQDFYTFMGKISRHFIQNILIPAHWYVCSWRYPLIDEKERVNMLPNINEPKKFDYIAESDISDQLDKAKKGNLSSWLVNQMELQLASKLINDPELLERVKAASDLDPFPSRQETDLLIMLQNGGVEQIDYVIHCYIYKFINQAVEEIAAKNKGKKGEDSATFFDLDYDNQLNMLVGYAKEVIANNSAAAKVKKALAPDPTADDPTDLPPGNDPGLNEGTNPQV